MRTDQDQVLQNKDEESSKVLGLVRSEDQKDNIR